MSSSCSNHHKQAQCDLLDAAFSSSSADENDIDHHFAVRFIPRPRHRANITRDLHGRKREPETAIVKPHDLAVVHDLLVALISREQHFQQKPVVTWESVQRRYSSMVCDLSSADRDLLLRYQPDLGFFPEVMDEQLLDVWTGKKSLFDVFSLSEFSDITCVREPLPPYGLLVLVDQSQRLSQNTNSIAIGTEENEEVPNFKFAPQSRKTRRMHALEEEPAVSVAPLLRPKLCPSDSDTLTATKQLLTFAAEPKMDAASLTDRHAVGAASTLKSHFSADALNFHGIISANYSCKSKQSENVAPEAGDLPNPLAFFRSSVNSSSSIEAAAASQNYKTDDQDGINGTSNSSSVTASSCLIKSGIPTCQKSAENLHSGHYKDGRAIFSIPDPDQERSITERSLLPIHMRAAKEVSPVVRATEAQRTLLPYGRRDFHALDKFVSSVSQRDSFVNSVMSSLSNSSSDSTANDVFSSPIFFKNLVTQKKDSVLSDLVFPETNAEVRRCLCAIQEAAAVCVAESGALLKMEAVLDELGEIFASEWVDYVLMYLPQVQVLPCNGQIFLAWKGM